MGDGYGYECIQNIPRVRVACKNTHWGRWTCQWCHLCVIHNNSSAFLHETPKDFQRQTMVSVWPEILLFLRENLTQSEGGNAVKAPAHTCTHKELRKHTAASFCPYHFLSKHNTAALKCLQIFGLQKRKSPSNKLLCAVYKHIHTPWVSRSWSTGVRNFTWKRALLFSNAAVNSLSIKSIF